MSETSSEMKALEARLEAFGARVHTLESELAEARRLAKKRRTALAILASSLIVIGATTAYAANGNCPNGLPFCFAANTPVKASEVNNNFAQLKEWLEAKVGTVAGPAIVPGNLTVNGVISNTNFLPQYTNWGTGGVGAGGAGITNDNGTYKSVMIVGNNSAGGNRKVQLFDDVTINGALTVTGSGGNGTHNCLVRTNAAGSYIALCFTGEVAVSGGGRCQSTWRIAESVPWNGGQDSDGPTSAGSTAHAWRSVCQDGGGTYAVPQSGAYAVCCQQ